VDITPRSRWRWRLQNALFVVLFLSSIGATAWLSTQYRYQADWTAGARNTLSEAGRRLLATLDQPVELIAFVKDDAALHRRIEGRIRRFQRHKPDIRLTFVNPDLEPERAKAAGVSRSGQLVIRMGGRRETVDDMAEKTLVNALQRLARGNRRWAVFLDGHGERDPFDQSNPGLRTLAENLEQAGFEIQGLNLIRTPAIPDNTAVLIVASPQRTLLAGEVEALLGYVRAGGHLLWLHDPGDLKGLAPLAQALGIRFVDGVIVDANPELRVMLGIKHPAVIPVVDYPQHDLTRNLKVQTLFPFSVGMAYQGDGSWTGDVFLRTLPRTWAETGPLTGGEIRFTEAEGDTRGPLALGMALTRELEGRQQRVIVIGDSDFLANAYLGNGANLELAMNVLNWLSLDDELISVTPRSAPDTQLALSDTALAVIAFGFLVVLPLGLLGTGLALWSRRRRR